VEQLTTDPHRTPEAGWMPAVGDIAHDRMPKVRQVHADLVGASGLQRDVEN